MQPETIKVEGHRGVVTMNRADYDAMAEKDQPKLATAAAIKKHEAAEAKSQAAADAAAAAAKE